MFNRKFAFAAALVALGTVAAGSAQASNVQWSVGINLPQVGTVISNAPVYQQPAYEPYYEPAPVYVQPVPQVVYRPAPQVIYRPAPVVVYRPVPVYGAGYYGPRVIRSGWYGPQGHHHDRDDRRDDRHDGRRDDRRDDRGDRRQHH
jgi:hypothetical protein